MARNLDNEELGLDSSLEDVSPLTSVIAPAEAAASSSELPQETQNQVTKMNSALNSLWASAHPDQPKPDTSSPEYAAFVRQNALNLNYDKFTDANSAEYEKAAPIKQKLSEYLNSNQFDKAIKYAEQNNASQYLQDPQELRQLRKPFTKEEAAEYLNAVPESWHKKSEIYTPSSALANSLNNWNAETGYPDYQAGVINPGSKEGAIFEALVKTALAGGLAVGAAPLLSGALGGLGGAGSSLSAAQAAAVKAAAGNMISTAIQGGDIGDVLKAGATAGVTAGLSSFAAPALNSALASAGLPESLAKAATNAAVSAGTAAARGQDPLQAGVISGFGTYVSLEGRNLASDFAAKTGISEDLAKQLIGPAGSAAATALVGGNALAAAANEYVNENSQKLIDSAKEKLGTMFPGTSAQIDKITDQIKDYAKEFKDSFGNLTSGPAPKVGALPSDDGMATVGITASRNPLVPIDVGFTGYQPIGPNGGLPTSPPPVEPSPVEPELEEVGVTAQKLPIPLDLSLNPFNPTVDIPEPIGALPPVEPELEEVEVNAKKLPETPINAISTESPLSTVTPVEPPPVDTPMEEVTVEAKKDPEKQPDSPLDFIKIGNYPKIGPDGMEEIEVTSTKPTSPLSPLVLNPFTPTVDIPDPTVNYPSNIGLTVKKPSSGGLDFESGASASPFSWLDTSDQFLKSKASTQGGTKLAELKQIFGQLDPSLQNVLADRGYGATPAASGGLIQAYADGGSTCCFKAILKDLAPNFAPCTQEMLAPLMARKPIPTTLAKLAHIKPYIAPTGGMGGMAKGGLPSKYAEAAPEGHNPEFITGLTGYYAQGGGTGQSDDIPAMLHDGDYVMDADTVAAFGDGSSKAGAEVLEHLREQVPHQSSGQGKAVPAKIADGEYVFPAAFVTALGGGDNKQGSKMLDAMREKLRAHKRSAPTSKIPPKAKSPLDYLRKG
jgi:hypothetical protein